MWINWKYAILPGFCATLTMDFINHIGSYLGYFYKIDTIMIGSLIACWIDFSFFFQKPIHVIHSAQDNGFGASPGFGLFCHYLIGIIFSIFFYLIVKLFRLNSNEQYIGAFIFGCTTAVISLLIIFPALGAGWYASKGGHLIMLGSVVNHIAFGIGLSLSYWLLNGHKGQRYASSHI